MSNNKCSTGPSRPSLDKLPTEIVERVLEELLVVKEGYRALPAPSSIEPNHPIHDAAFNIPGLEPSVRLYATDCRIVNPNDKNVIEFNQGDGRPVFMYDRNSLGGQRKSSLHPAILQVSKRYNAIDLISHLLTANPPVKCWELTPELAFPTSVLTFREPPFVMGRSDPVRRFLVDVRDIDLAVHIYGKLLHRRRVPGRPWCGPVRVIVDADRTSRGCLVQRQALRVVLRYHIAPLLHDIIGELVLSKPLQSKPLHGPKSVFHKTNSELAKMRQNALIVGLPCFISTFESFQNFVRDLINFNAGGDWPQTRTVSFELEVHHFLRLWASIYTLFRTHGNVLTHNVLLHFHIVLKDILGMLYFHLGFMLTRQRLPRTFANHTRRTRKALIAAGSDYLYFVVHQNLLREKNCSPIYTYIMYLLAVADAKSNDLPFEAYSSSNCTAAFMAACQPLPTNVNPATHTAQTILVALADAQEPYESPFPENTYVWWAGAWSRRLATVGPDYAIMGAIGAAWHRYIGVGNGNMIDEKDRWTRPLERWAMDSAWRAEFYEGLGDIVAEMLRETFGQRPEQMDVFRNLQWM